MQIGITVSGFRDLDGVLVMELSVQFNHPSIERGEASGTVPFNATQPQAVAAARQWITDNYNVTVPANASIRVIGL